MGRDRIAPGFDRKQLGLNPFSETLVIVAVNITEDKHLYEAKDLSDNMVVNVSERRQFCFTLEKQTYTKVFRSPEMRKKIVGLRGNSNKLFNWIVFEVKPADDYVVVNIDRCKEECGFNHNTYLSCMKELIDVDIVARTPHNKVFWLNPQVFFCGNRIKKYPNNVIV